MNSEGVRGRATMVFDINDGSSSVSPPSGKQWQIGQEQVSKYLDNGDLFIREGKVIIKMRPHYERSGIMQPFWGLFNKDIGTTESAKKELKYIVKDSGFETVKPVEMIKRLIYHASSEDSIVLDFFSGSATTAHAVMELNVEDYGSRKYIMVQIPEVTEEKSAAYKSGYKKISDIGRERIRRAGEKILEDNKDKEKMKNLDIGFKVFRVDDTNFRRIKETNKDLEAYKHRDISAKELEDFNPHFTDIDVVYELILRRQDIKLTEEIVKLENIGERTYIVGDTVLVCLEENITEEIIEKIGEIDSDLSWIVLRDSAFGEDCDLKINSIRKLRSIIKESKNKEQKIYWI